MLWRFLGSATGVCVRMTVAGAVYVIWRLGRFILWLTGGSYPLPRAVLFRQAVTRYDFCGWNNLPCTDVTHRRFYSATDSTYSTGNPAILVISDGPQSNALSQSGPTVPPPVRRVIAFASASPQLTVGATI